MTPATLLPNRKTRALAARMVNVAQNDPYEAARLLRNLDPGQGTALLVVLLGALGKGTHRDLDGERLPHRPIVDTVACVTCGALAFEPCRGRNGHGRKDHPERLGPRCCPCGAGLPERTRDRYCSTCKVEARRAVQRRKEGWKRTGDPRSFSCGNSLHQSCRRITCTCGCHQQEDA